MSDQTNKVKFGLAMLVMVTLIPLVIFHGWVISKLWLWFVVPALGLAPLTIPLALGLGSFVLYFVWRPNPKDLGKTTEEYILATVYLYFRPVAFLLVGWIFMEFM